jgi:hypothetical protein
MFLSLELGGYNSVTYKVIFDLFEPMSNKLIDSIEVDHGFTQPSKTLWKSIQSNDYNFCSHLVVNPSEIYFLRMKYSKVSPDSTNSFNSR